MWWFVLSVGLDFFLMFCFRIFLFWLSGCGAGFVLGGLDRSFCWLSA